VNEKERTDRPILLTNHYHVNVKVGLDTASAHNLAQAVPEKFSEKTWTLRHLLLLACRDGRSGLQAV
jgi:hypothetical protein